MDIIGNNASVNIDGRSFIGNSISIHNGKVIVDGVEQSGNLTGDINVIVEGDIESLSNMAGKITAQNVGTIDTQSGNVFCDDVSGNVETMSGNVTAKSILGNVETMSGNVNYNHNSRVKSVQNT